MKHRKLIANAQRDVADKISGQLTEDGNISESDEQLVAFREHSKTSQKIKANRVQLWASLLTLIDMKPFATSEAIEKIHTAIQKALENEKQKYGDAVSTANASLDCDLDTALGTWVEGLCKAQNVMSERIKEVGTFATAELLLRKLDQHARNTMINEVHHRIEYERGKHILGDELRVELLGIGSLS